MSDQLKIRQSPPIQYPTITVPGKGTFVVKFGLGASYTLEEEMGLDPAQFAQRLQEWFPKLDDSGAQIRPGRVSQSFLFKVLAACIYDQARMEPRELADCFTHADVPAIARTIAEAFSKTQWSRETPLQEAATTAEQAPKPN